MSIATRVAEQQRCGAVGDALFRALTFLFALLVLLILGGVIVSLIGGALPALRTFGLAFLVTENWNPVTEKFGALAPIYGTLVTSAIAMLVGIPVAFGVAVFITEICPLWLKRPLATMIELLAAIPSIIYGIWGLFVLAPFFQDYIEPALIGSLGEVPGLGLLFSGPPLGIGVLTAGFILAVMVLPLVSSIMRDVFLTVPPVLKESAYALGATTAEVACRSSSPMRASASSAASSWGSAARWARRWRSPSSSAIRITSTCRSCSRARRSRRRWPTSSPRRSAIFTNPR
jgi:phosphate transport system permease protein